MFFRQSVKGVVIDPGHGGEDPGASGNGIVEKDYNLNNSLYMYNRLKELGVPVKITRTTDETLSREERISRLLNAFGNNSNVIAVSNHINAGGGDGAEVIYALRNNDQLAKSVLESIGNAGQNMRKYYQRRLPSDPSKDYYYIMRDSGNVETILIEYGFLDSPGDDVTQLKNNNLDYVEAAVKAIVEYAGYTYVPPAGSNLYVVKKGDSLWSIANSYGITVDELVKANNLQSNLLNIGQTLIIPTKEIEAPTEEFEVYIVQKGDNLYKIANMFDVSVDDLIKLNNLGTTTLSINQQLLIPKSSLETGNIYTVKSGDSLYSIALNYGVTVDELKNVNNLTSNTLSIGQVLIIPTKEEPGISEVVYIVQKGDSLWSIAKKYNITVNQLKDYNNLTDNTLSINQKLVIPQTGDYETYVVKSGDSLWSIANANNTTVEEIKKVNNLTSNNLSIGQVLLIP